jgi:hypothetical protein
MQKSRRHKAVPIATVGTMPYRHRSIFRKHGLVVGTVSCAEAVGIELTVVDNSSSNFKKKKINFFVSHWIIF